MFNLDGQAKESRSLVYARAMRVVGLLLQTRDLKTFDLQCDSSGFLLQCGNSKPPCPTTFELRYSFDEIESLERESLISRKNSASAVDFLSPAEVLRGLGGYVDKRKGHLLKLSNNHSNLPMGFLRLDYESSDGDRREETFSQSSIYDICVHMYKERGKTKTQTKRFANSFR